MMNLWCGFFGGCFIALAIPHDNVSQALYLLSEHGKRIIGARVLSDNYRREDSKALKVNCIRFCEVGCVCEYSIHVLTPFRIFFL